jgi:hypothetical protein
LGVDRIRQKVAYLEIGVHVTQPARSYYWHLITWVRSSGIDDRLIYDRAFFEEQKMHALSEPVRSIQQQLEVIRIAGRKATVSIG